SEHTYSAGRAATTGRTGAVFNLQPPGCRGSRYCWTMWLGALITSLLFVAAHSQYQNLLTLAELFLVGLITSVARIRSGGLLLPVLLHMEATTLGLLFG
ncbi:CPBP family intramembrane glutamic endopeptidase, partial [Salmonella enterica subsp. enterica serovar Enteritidis]